MLVVIIPMVDLSGDGTNQYEACDDVSLRRCGNCDNCMQAIGRATQDIKHETSQPMDVAVVDALSQDEVDTNFKLREREHARAVRRRRRDEARARRQQLASASAVARSH